MLSEAKHLAERYRSAVISDIVMLSEAKHLAERYQSAVISDIVMLDHQTWNDPLERVA